MLDQPKVVEPSLSALQAADEFELESEAETQVLPVVTAPTDLGAAVPPPPDQAERAPYRVPGRPLVLGALVVALTLAALHFGAVALAAVLPADAFRVPEAVKLNNEATVATWFSSVVDLLDAALLAVLTAAAPVGQRWRWMVTTAAVLCVSIDEISGFHEDLSWVLHNALHTTGLFTYAWVGPALVPVVVVGLLCLKIILPRPGGWAVLIGGLVYVAGAAGVEVFEGWWVDATGLGGDNAVFLLLNGIEETMEMVGAIVAMAGLLRMADGCGLRLVAEPLRPRAQRASSR